MTKNSKNSSEKISKETLDAIHIVNDVSSKSGIPLFIIGATARDIIFHGYEVVPARATLDVDLGIMVSDWEEYQKMRGIQIEKRTLMTYFL